MGLLWLNTIIFLLSEGCDFCIGADDFTVQFESQKTCFQENTNITMVVEYVGEKTPDVLRLLFSQMTDWTNSLNILTGLCVDVPVADPAFPVNRMSYTCDNINKRYTINIADFNESSDAGTWEVAISVDGAFTNFKNVTVEKCPDDYPSDPSFSNPQPGGGGTIHGNPGNANREERGTEVTPETPPSQTAEKANTTPPKVQESYLSRPESSDPKSKQGRSGLDQSEKKTQRNDPPQDEHRENRRDRRSRFQPRRLPNFMRNFWNSLSRVVCKSASNNTVNAGNDPDKETRL